MMRWELWSGEGGHSFFRENNDQARRMAQEDGYALAWEVHAAGYVEAMTLMHEHLGYEPYQPMLLPDGTPAPDPECDE